LKENILHLKITWPKDINIDAKNLIKKILKSDPATRLSLEDMLQHPFFTKYFPNAVKSLIKPDENAIYKSFIVSKDNPKTWEPIDKNGKPNSKGNSPKRQKSPERAKSPKNEEISQEKYDELIDKYANLQKEYETLKASSPVSNEIEEIKKQIKEKDERITQLVKAAKESGEDPDESNLKNKCLELEKENNELKEKVNKYEEIIKEKQGSNVDNKLKEFRDSITGSDKDSVSNALENMKNNLDKETREKLNEIIKEKEKEIKKFKDDEKLRREKEKKKFITLINKYDKTLSWVEKENKELKAKIKELEQEGTV
jgi:DNA repair exonuclease SbcCD ATPase subunit